MSVTNNTNDGMNAHYQSPEAKWNAAIINGSTSRGVLQVNTSAVQSLVKELLIRKLVIVFYIHLM